MRVPSLAWDRRWWFLCLVEWKSSCDVFPSIVCVCVCVWEKERECVCVCVCMFEREIRKWWWMILWTSEGKTHLSPTMDLGSRKKWSSTPPPLSFFLTHTHKHTFYIFGRFHWWSFWKQKIWKQNVENVNLKLWNQIITKVVLNLWTWIQIK